eukprot:5395101-Alexandrium_andersonii.AAC.1
MAGVGHSDVSADPAGMPYLLSEGTAETVLRVHACTCMCACLLPGVRAHECARESARALHPCAHLHASRVRPRRACA